MYTDVLVHPFRARICLVPFVPSVKTIIILMYPRSVWVFGNQQRYAGRRPHSPLSVLAAVPLTVSSWVHLRNAGSSGTQAFPCLIDTSFGK